MTVAQDPVAWSDLVLDGYTRPGAGAIVDAEHRWSGDEFVARCRGAGRWLADLGPDDGQSPPALLSNAARSLALLVGGAAIGRPLSPLGIRSTVHEILACDAVRSSPIVLAERSVTDLAEGVAARTGARIAWVEDVPADGPALPTGPSTDAVAAVLHTSGTTGVPKRVELTQGRLAKRAVLNARLLQLDTSSVFAAASGFHHIGGVGNLAVALGAGAGIACLPRFTVQAWQGLPDLGVTHVQTVPSMIEMLLVADALAIPGIRVLLYGASQIRPETLRRLVTEMPDTDVLTLFGQTEGSPLTFLSPDDHRRAIGGAEHLLESVGRPVDGLELRLLDPDENGVGEVLTRGAHLFLTDEHGWQHTGDLARIDDQGYVYLAGRRGDRIIRGGENIYPVEVENVLVLHEGVADAAVVGVPDDRLGETVRAYVVAANPAVPPDPGDLHAFVRARLAGFKVPAQWEFLPALPRNQNGKVLRRALAKSSGTR